MKEIEVKILDIDVETVTKKLRAIGAKKAFEADIEGVIFNGPGNLLVRLRKKGKICEFTTKKKISKKTFKVMEEHEVNVSSYDKMMIIMEQLGYVVKTRFKKHRTSYKTKDAHFEIDKYPNIPPFLEIESKDVDTFKKYVELLDYGMEDTKPWSAKDVHKFYGKKL